MPHFMKIGPVGAELFYADRRTDMQELRSEYSLFRSFANAPESECGHIKDLGIDGLIICS